MTTLIERIDLALERAGKTRGDLARALGVSVQSISNMKRKGPHAAMRTENVARAARFMGCDVYWLCTGEPDTYTPAPQRSQLAQEAAAMIEQMDSDSQNSAFTKVYMVWRSRSKRFSEVHYSPAPRKANDHVLPNIEAPSPKAPSKRAAKRKA